MILPTGSRKHRQTTKDDAVYEYQDRTDRLDPNEYFPTDDSGIGKSMPHSHKKTHNDGGVPLKCRAAPTK